MLHSWLFRLLKRPLIRLNSRTVPPDGASGDSGLDSRPNVVPGEVFETNINFLYQLEKPFRKTIKRKWKFPSDDIGEQNRNKVGFTTMFFDCNDEVLCRDRFLFDAKELKWNLYSWVNACFSIWTIWQRSDLNFNRTAGSTVVLART